MTPRLHDLPHLLGAVRVMGADSGSRPIETAFVPSAWRARCRLANLELQQLTANEIEDLAAGEETDQMRVAAKAPHAHEVLTAAFDSGPLAAVFLKPPHNAFDAIAAEQNMTLQQRVDLSLSHALENGYAEILTWPPADIAADLMAYDDGMIDEDRAALEACCADWLRRRQQVPA